MIVDDILLRTAVTYLGLDGFALKRGDKYGTILINAESGKPLDLLPDRTAEAVKPWPASHPEIQLVSRDRVNGFAEAVSQVLPHATQGALTATTSSKTCEIIFSSFLPDCD